MHQGSVSALQDTARRAFRAAGRTLVITSFRALASLGIVATAFWTSGCYSYLPQTGSEVTLNSIVAADITDAGRIALGERVGPEVKSIQGKVVEQSDTAIRVLVSQVTYLNGMENQWQGQEVSLRTQDVKSFTKRTFSRSRTVIAIGAIAAGLLLTFLSLDFLGLTSGDSGRDKPGEPPPSS